MVPHWNRAGIALFICLCFISFCSRAVSNGAQHAWPSWGGNPARQANANISHAEETLISSCTLEWNSTLVRGTMLMGTPLVSPQGVVLITTLSNSTMVELQMFHADSLEALGPAHNHGNNGTAQRPSTTMSGRSNGTFQGNTWIVPPGHCLQPGSDLQPVLTSSGMVVLPFPTMTCSTGSYNSTFVLGLNGTLEALSSAEYGNWAIQVDDCHSGGVFLGLTSNHEDVILQCINGRSPRSLSRIGGRSGRIVWHMKVLEQMLGPPASYDGVMYLRQTCRLLAMNETNQAILWFQSLPGCDTPFNCYYEHCPISPISYFGNGTLIASTTSLIHIDVANATHQSIVQKSIDTHHVPYTAAMGPNGTAWYSWSSASQSAVGPLQATSGGLLGALLNETTQSIDVVVISQPGVVSSTVVAGSLALRIALGDAGEVSLSVCNLPNMLNASTRAQSPSCCTRGLSGLKALQTFSSSFIRDGAAAGRRGFYGPAVVQGKGVFLLAETGDATLQRRHTSSSPPYDKKKSGAHLVVIRPSSPHPKRDDHLTLIIVISCVSGVLVMGATCGGAIGCLYAMRNRKRAWSLANGGTSYSRLPMGRGEIDVSQAEEMAKAGEFYISPTALSFENVVGRGGFGTVWKGKWNGTQVAIKVLDTSRMEEASHASINGGGEFGDEHLPHQQLMDEYVREIIILSKLRHPNVVSFLGASFDTERGSHAIVERYYERGSVWQLIADAESPLSPSMVHSILMDVCQGMAFLHNRTPPIIHRDLKTPNLLLDVTGKVVITDFGLSKVIPEVSETFTTAIGTVHWMAPELIAGAEYSSKVDVYSFGIIMWELLHRRRPFFGMNRFMVASEVINGGRPVVLEAHKEEPYVLLMTQCWAHSPSDRPSFTQLLKSVERLHLHEAIFL